MVWIYFLITDWFIVGSDWVDPEDPTVIAENELLGAANSIEAAAKKLAMLKPRQKARVRKIRLLLSVQSEFYVTLNDHVDSLNS